MNIVKRTFIICGCLAALALGSNRVMAQGGGGGGFDPSRFRQMRVDRAQEQLEITNNEEWKAIEPLVGKVVDAQFSMMAGRFGGGRGGRNRGGDNNNGDQPRRPRFGGEPSAAQTALQEAIDNKAPDAELKAKTAAVRTELKAKEDALKAAEDDLRGVLTVRQEAIAVADGLLR